MAEGTVRWFNPDKGYGRIAPDRGPEVFVHYSAIQANGYKSLDKGDRVSFAVERGPQGPQAVQVTVLGTSTPPSYASSSPRSSRVPRLQWGLFVILVLVALIIATAMMT